MSRAARKVSQNVVPLFQNGLPQQFRNFLSEFLATQTDGVCVARRADGFVELANETFSKWFQVKGGDILSSEKFPEFYDLFWDEGRHEEVPVGDRHLDFYTSCLRNQETEYFVISARDVSVKVRLTSEVLQKYKELKDLQEALVQAGKLAALGELTAGIGHEVNQPLQIMKGYAQEAQERVVKLQAQTGLPSAVQQHVTSIDEDLKEVVQAVTRMERIIASLRNFTTDGSKDFQDVDLTQAFRSALALAGATLRAQNIAVHEDWALLGDQTGIYANPTLLEQIFINLINNARDAILAARVPVKKGTDQIVVTAKKIFLDYQGLERPFIEVQFSDTGSGIPSGIKSKIFNPFFTTKEVGKGMGLGLSLVQNMVTKLHGTISFESQWGEGTTFTIRLPVNFREF